LKWRSVSDAPFPPANHAVRTNGIDPSAATRSQPNAAMIIPCFSSASPAFRNGRYRAAPSANEIPAVIARGASAKRSPKINGTTREIVAMMPTTGTRSPKSRRMM